MVNLLILLFFTELTDDDVTAQALLFFIAGFDTISTAICHMCYELALNEDIQIKLQKEVDETFEKCDGKLTYDALLNMKYLDMVLSGASSKIFTICLDKIFKQFVFIGMH